MGIEADLKKLEKIVNELHSEKVPLEEAIEKFEDGVKLAGACIKSLDVIRKKIEVISKTKDGKMKLKPFKKDD